MRKLIAILIILCIPLFGFAEDVVIHTTKGDHTLIVPEDYDSLRANYITMAGLYWGERNDLEDSLANTANALAMIADMRKAISDQGDLLNQAVTAMNKKKLFEDGLFGGIAIGMNNPTTIGGFVGYQIFISENFNVGVQLGINPNTIGIFAGWKF
jgi:hypothetical protein